LPNDVKSAAESPPNATPHGNMIDRRHVPGHQDSRIVEQKTVRLFPIVIISGERVAFVVQ